MDPKILKIENFMKMTLVTAKTIKFNEFCSLTRISLPCGARLACIYMTRRAVLFSSNHIISNTDAGLSVGPDLRCREPIFERSFRQIIVFSPQGRDSCFFAITQLVLNELPAARAHTSFCYTSPAKRLVQIYPPFSFSESTTLKVRFLT